MGDDEAGSQCYEYCGPDPGRVKEPEAHPSRQGENDRNTQGTACGCGCGSERYHDAKTGEHVTESRQHTPPPLAARMPEEDTELDGSAPRQHMHQGQAFEKALFGDPLPLFLELRLHEAHDRGTAVRRGTQLQKTHGDLLPVPCEICVWYGRHVCLLCLGRCKACSHTPEKRSFRLAATHPGLFPIHPPPLREV